MFEWNPSPIAFRLPFIHYPIAWYGVFFAIGFWLATLLFTRLASKVLGCRLKARKLCDSLMVSVILGVVFGSRFFHLIFYESPSKYLTDPSTIFRFWEGGLASHGGIFAVILALFLFARRSNISFYLLLDLIISPGLLLGFFIRIGNFINQEVLGTPTDLPWGVLFLNPFGQHLIVPRHPTQLYESIAYLFMAIIGVLLFKIRKEISLAGILLLLLGIFRFGIEFIKEEQSVFSDKLPLLMGQLLSIPLILLGLFLIIREYHQKKDAEGPMEATDH